MNRSFLILIMTLSASLFSCKKEKLEGDTAILTGTWKWTETFNVGNYCDHDSTWTYSIVDSTSTDNTFSLEFLEKGKVTFLHNGGVVNTNRVVFNSDAQETFTTGPYDFKFEILINNKSSDIMEVLVGQDSLLLYDYPKDTETPCEEYFNHFVKG